MIISFLLTTFPFDSRVILWGETRGQLLFYILYFLNKVPWHLFEILSKKRKGGALRERRMFHLGGGHLLRNNQPVLIPLIIWSLQSYTQSGNKNRLPLYSYSLEKWGRRWIAYWRGSLVWYNGIEGGHTLGRGERGCSFGGGGCSVRRGKEGAHLRGGGKRALIKAWALSQGSKVYSFSTQA